MISETTGVDFQNYWGRFPKLLGSISIHAVWFERSSLPMCTFVRYHTLSRTIVHGGTLEYAFRRIIVSIFDCNFPHTPNHPIPSTIQFANPNVSNIYIKAIIPVKYQLFSKIIAK